MTSKMIFRTTRLQLYTMLYTRKDKYKSQHTIKKEKSRYKRKQPGYTITKRRTIDIKNINLTRDFYITVSYNNCITRTCVRALLYYLHLYSILCNCLPSPYIINQ